MASEAPTTGARTRAPTMPRRDVPAPEASAHDQLLARIRDIQVAAEAIDAVVLGVEVMLEDQRRIMRDENAGNFLCDNELWAGAATLLAIVRERAIAIGELGETIEKAEMRVPDAPAAA